MKRKIIPIKEEVPTEEQFRNFVDVYSSFEQPFDPIALGLKHRSPYIFRRVFPDISYSDEHIKYSVGEFHVHKEEGEPALKDLEKNLKEIKTKVCQLPGYRFFENNQGINDALRKLFKHFKPYYKKKNKKIDQSLQYERDLISFQSGLAYCFSEYLSDLKQELKGTETGLLESAAIDINIDENNIHFSKHRDYLLAKKDHYQGVGMLKDESHQELILITIETKLRSLDYMERGKKNKGLRYPEKALVARLSYNFLTWACLYGVPPLYDWLYGAIPSKPLDNGQWDKHLMIKAAINADRSNRKPSEAILKNLRGVIFLLANQIANSEHIKKMYAQHYGMEWLGSEYHVLARHHVRYTFNNVEEAFFMNDFNAFG